MTTIDITPKKGIYHIGKTELVHILLATVVMSVGFCLLFKTGGVYKFFRHYFGDAYFVAMFAVMFVIMILSFVGHELGHKFVAQKYGMWSEFRVFPIGLLITLVSGFLGILIAAPGAVMISGDHYSKEEDCKISVAGPLVNIVLAAVGFAGTLLFNNTALLVPFYLLLMLNASLALFNLLPIPPLDGSKIIGTDFKLWIACMALAVLEFGGRFFLPELYWA